MDILIAVYAIIWEPLCDLFPHKYIDEGFTFRASLMNIEAAARVFLAPRDMDHFNKVLRSSCRK
jgi:hypothetical protein